MPSAAAPKRSLCKAIRLRSRQLSCRIGSMPFVARIAAAASGLMLTRACAPSVTLTASARPRSGNALSSSTWRSADAGGAISAVTANCPARRIFDSRDMARSLMCVAATRDAVALVPEPQASVLLQHLARRLEILLVAHHAVQLVVLDLIDVDHRIPRREQGRGADRGRDFVRHGVQVVAEQRTVVGIGVEVEILGVAAEHGLDRAQQFVAIHLERTVAGPDLLHDLGAGIVAVGMHTDQAAARAERARQRRNHPLRLELGRGTRTIGLRGDDEIIVAACCAPARADMVEQKLAVLEVDNEHERLVVHRVAGLGADPRGPVLTQEWLQLGDLLLEIARGVT